MTHAIEIGREAARCREIELAVAVSGEYAEQMIEVVKTVPLNGAIKEK